MSNFRLTCWGTFGIQFKINFLKNYFLFADTDPAQYIKTTIPPLTLSGPRGGGQYCPEDLWQALQQKLEKPANWIFLTIPEYVYTLTSKKKTNFMWTLTGLLRGVLIRPVKICCANFGKMYYFNFIMCHRFYFRDRKKYWCTLTGVFFSSDIFTIFNRPFYIARDRAPVSARMIHKCLIEVYKGYIINHISHKLFFIKPNWVKRRQILGGQYCPPPWTWW